MKIINILVSMILSMALIMISTTLTAIVRIRELLTALGAKTLYVIVIGNITRPINIMETGMEKKW